MTQAFKPKLAPSYEPDRLLELRPLIRELLEDKCITQDDAESLLLAPRTREQLHLHPLIWVAQQEFKDPRRKDRKLDLESLTLWLSERSGQAYYRIDPMKINTQMITRIMSFEFTQRHHILALEVHEDHVIIGSSQPYVREWESILAQTLAGRSIKRVVCNPAELRRHTIDFYSIASSVDKAQQDSDSLSSITNLEQMLELKELKSPEANDEHIVNIVDWLLQYAFSQRASDIHIEPRREKGNLRFRIDGVMHLVYELPIQVTAAVTSRLKTLGRMDVAEKRRPQDGRIKTKNQDGNEVELRLSTLPTAFGEKMVMRIFDPDVLLKSFQQLGLANEDYQKWQDMIGNPHGIVLVTGPTGSGKTTTLYSSLKALAVPEVNVCTIEDPIEMVESSFNQMQVQANIQLTFASGVRALLRQDPDIIMIGEIRDLDTAEMATQAALTGHLVLSTLHTNDAPTAVTRLIELGVPPYLIKATIIGVMAQRLVRSLCPHCKKPAAIEDSVWQSLTYPWKVATPKRIYQAQGCLECRNTGYRGRMGIYEIMLFSEAVKSAIGEQTDLTELRRIAMKEGMRTLRLSGAQKVASGLTTPEEVLRVVPLGAQQME